MHWFKYKKAQKQKNQDNYIHVYCGPKKDCTQSMHGLQTRFLEMLDSENKDTTLFRNVN